MFSTFRDSSDLRELIANEWDFKWAFKRVVLTLLKQLRADVKKDLKNHCMHHSKYRVVLNLQHSPPLSPWGVLYGVASIMFGVWIAWCFGVTPSKSLWVRGVFIPPFKGVSTLDKARIFWASWWTEQSKLVNDSFIVTTCFSVGDSRKFIVSVYQPQNKCKPWALEQNFAGILF